MRSHCRNHRTHVPWLKGIRYHTLPIGGCKKDRLAVICVLGQAHASWLEFSQLPVDFKQVELHGRHEICDARIEV